MKKKKVLVVTHDAGGSEIIAAYVKANRAKYKLHVYTNGPGARIFRRLKIPFHRTSENRAEIRKIIRYHSDYSFALLALPGWMTRIEITALEEAKRAGLKTVVYLEDWRMYRERFGYLKRDWKKRLPDELWAGDRPAYELARKQFKGLPISVQYVRNEYFRSVIKRYRLLRKRGYARRILFLSSAWGRDGVFANLIKCLSESDVRATVRIRFHPADDRRRYDAVIRRYRGRVSVEKSSEKNVAKDLARAQVVVGAQTAVLAIAALCGIPTFDIVSRAQAPSRGRHPSWTVRLASSLPFPGVIRAKSVQEAFQRIARRAAAKRV